MGAYLSLWFNDLPGMFDWTQMPLGTVEWVDVHSPTTAGKPGTSDWYRHHWVYDRSDLQTYARIAAILAPLILESPA